MVELLLAVWRFFTGIFTWLFQNPKVLAAIVIFAAISTTYFLVTHKIESLETAVASLTEENKNLKKAAEIYAKNYQVTKEVNDNNQRVINNLTSTNNKLKEANGNLKKDSEANKGDLDKLKADLDKMSKEQDGPIAEVLKRAIMDIDKNRAKRDTK